MALRPLTPKEMLERCDLAGIARVVATGRASQEAPMLAKLSFVSLAKGEPRDARGEPATFAYVSLHGGSGYDAQGQPIVGGWSDWWDYPVGATVMTHLDWSDVEGAYETTWPGAVWEVQPPAAPIDGRVFEAARASQARGGEGAEG